LSRDRLALRGDFAHFFRCAEAKRSPSLATCSVSFPSLGAPPWLHQTLIEVLSLLRQRVQRPLWGSLYDLATSLYPRPVLCKGVAERMPFASESQARRRGSTRLWDTTIAASLGAGADVQSKAKGSEPKGLWAPRRSMTQRNTHCRARHAGSARRGPVRRWAHPLRLP
jgi:hypothetical protein